MREKSLKLMKWKRRNVTVDGTNEEAQRDLRVTDEHLKRRVGDENAKEMKRRCVRDEARRVRERRWKLMGIDMRLRVREKVKIGKDDREKQGERRETERVD
jgi:hypothetical protein